MPAGLTTCFVQSSVFSDSQLFRTVLFLARVGGGKAVGTRDPPTISTFKVPFNLKRSSPDKDTYLASVASVTNAFCRTRA